MIAALDYSCSWYIDTMSVIYNSNGEICLYRKIGEPSIEGFTNISFDEFVNRLRDRFSNLKEMLSFL